MYRYSLCSVVAAMLALVGAPSIASDPVTVHDGWVREMPPGTQNAAAYLTLRNHGSIERKVVGVETDASPHAELHTLKHEQGAMKMQQIDALVIPIHGSAELAAGGDHVMLLDVESRLTEGDSVTVTLSFANGEKQIAVLPVKRGKAMKHEHDAVTDHSHGTSHQKSNEDTGS